MINSQYTHILTG